MQVIEEEPEVLEDEAADEVPVEEAPVVEAEPEVVEEAVEEVSESLSVLVLHHTIGGYERGSEMIFCLRVSSQCLHSKEVLEWKGKE